MVCGRVLLAAVIAACTSWAARSMLRLRLNCTVIDVAPSALNEVISVMPAICPIWRSSGVATEDAMVSALAPASVAVTSTVGKSTCGSGATGRNGNAARPRNASAPAISEVATGRRMNGSERFTSRSRLRLDRVVAGDHPDKQPLGPALNRGARNRERVAAGFDKYTGIDEIARPQRVIVIGEQRLQADGGSGL